VIVKGLKIEVRLNVSSYYNFITDEHETGEGSYYKIWHTLETDNGNIFDGKVSYLIWEAIKGKINIDKFPNFKKPEFINK